MKYITIASDVSCSAEYQISTWACYIRYDGGVIKEVGEFKQYYHNTAVAETYALINALTIAKNNIPDWSESKIIIHNEVEHVLDPVKTRAGNIKKRDLDRAEKIQLIAIPILKQALEWERRKIKAHYKDWQQSSNPRKYAINRWCDQESRKLMKSIRRQKKQQIRKQKSACA